MEYDIKIGDELNIFCNKCGEVVIAKCVDVEKALYECTKCGNIA